MERVIFSILLFLSYPTFADEELFISASEFPPYEYTLQGDPIVRGFSSELVQATFRNMNQPISQHKIFPWKRALQGTYFGVFDAVHSASKNKEREEKLWFPDEPLVYSSKVFIIRKADKQKINYQSFDSLIGLRLGLVRGFNYPENVWSFIKNNDIQYNESVNTDTLLKMLVRGRVDIIIEESVVAKQFIDEHSYPLELIEDHPVQVKPMYLAFSKESVASELVAKFSDNLKDYKKTEQFLTLCKKYKVTCFDSNKRHK